MSKTRIHIDQLFAQGLENLEIPVSASTFDTIKKDVGENNASHSAFDNFELPVSDADWQMIKAKLAMVQAISNQNTIESNLKEIEIPVTHSDWKGIQARLEKDSGRAAVILPTEFAREKFNDFEIAVTDADWHGTKDKLNQFKKRKLVWWYWLNIMVVGTLIGLSVAYFSPINNSSAIVSQLDATSITSKHNTSKANEIAPKAITPLKKDAVSSESNKNETAPKSKTSEKVNKTAIKSNVLNKPESKAVEISLQTSNKYNASLEVVAEKSNTISQIPPSNNDALENKVVENTAKPSVSEIEKDPITNSIEKVNEEIDPAISSNTENNTDAKKIDASANDVAAVVVPNDSSKKKEDKTKIKKPPFKLPLNYYAGISTDVVSTYRKLSSTNPAAYNTIRNNADKPSIQMAYGFVAGVQKGHSQFQSGFQYTQQTFTSSYNYTLIYYDSLSVYNGQGQLIGKFPIGKAKEKHVEQHSEVIIKKINIPFNYNYFWRLNDKTQLITGVSGILSINVKASGSKMLNPANNQLYNYSYFKQAEQKVGFSPAMNLGIQRKLNSHLMLQSNVYGSYSVTNRYDNQFTAKQYSYSTTSSSFPAKEYLYGYGLSIKLLYLLR